MKLLINILLWINLYFLSPFVLAAVQYPSEFSEFFSETELKIHVIVAGERLGQDIVATVNYESFSLQKESAGDLALREFLQQKGLKSSAIDKILSDAYAGILSDPECQKRLSHCILSTENGDPRYIFDFDGASLKIFVPATALNDAVDNREYEEAMNEANSLINWANLYAYTDLSGEQFLTLSNLTTLGLPLGYLTLDTQYKTEESELKVYTATYDAEYNNYRVQAGLNEYNFSFNSTDVLNNGAQFAGYGLFLGSSKNLVKGKREALQRIYFFAPQNGQLEIYRDDRLIFNKVVNEGKQFVSYAELPGGVYEITILLKVAGQVVSTETRQVVNNNSFSLLTGEFDYVVGVGRIDDDTSDIDNELKYKGNYAKAATSYRFNDHFIFSTGVTLDEDDQLYQVGGNFFFGDKLVIDYVASFFSDNETYQAANLSYAPFFVDFRDFNYDLSNPSVRLSSQLYGTNSYQDIGIGISGSLFDSSGYLRYSLYSFDMGWQSDERFSNERWMLTGGLSRQLSNGNISVNFDYFEDDDNQSELRTNISWTHNFEDNKSAQVSVNLDKDGFSYNTNTLRAEIDGERWYVNGATGITIDKDNEITGDVSATAVGDTDYVRANAYAYTSDQGVSTLSGSLSGTQIVTTNSVDLTKDKARSFVKINQNMDLDEDSNAEDVKYTITKDGQYSHRADLGQKTKIVKLDEYKHMELILDDSSNSVDIEQKRHQKFIHPGTFYQIEAKGASLQSQIIILEDFYGNPVQQVQCVGDGCVNIETLSDDGVIRVNYRKSLPYRLVSRKGLCIFDEQNLDNYSYGYCLPGLETSKEQANWRLSSNLLKNNDYSELLIYLGKFQKGQEASNITDRLTSLDIAFKNIDVANDVYIYIIQDKEFSQAQRTLLQDLDAYVLLRSSEIDLLTIKESLRFKNGV